MDDGATENEYLIILFNHVTNCMALYDRCCNVWSAQLPASTFYQHYPNYHDWGSCEDGTFVPKGAPMDQNECDNKFEMLMSKIDINKANKAIFDEDSFKALVELLKIGKLACPGMVIRRPELDLMVKGILKACFIEAIRQYTSGKGQHSGLSDIWKELREFDQVTIKKDMRFQRRPSVSVHITESKPKQIVLVDSVNLARKGAPLRTINAAAKISFQSRILVRYSSP